MKLSSGARWALNASLCYFAIGIGLIILGIVERVPLDIAQGIKSITIIPGAAIIGWFLGSIFGKDDA